MEYIIGSAASFLLTEILIRIFSPRLRSKKIVGRDVHKPGMPEIPERLGIAMLLAFSSSCLAIYAVNRSPSCLIVVLSSLLGGIIGLMDDELNLGGRMKPLISATAALPLILSGLASPRPLLPLIGHARLYYVYWPLLIVFFAVIMNAVNMMDCLNGMMPSSLSAVLLGIIVQSMLIGKYDIAGISAVLLFAVLAYLRHNWYPARVFGGNVGSLFLGSAVASISALSNLEMFTVISMLPFFITGFVILFSVGGFKERREMKARPTIVENGYIRANPDENAPMTLISILTSDVPKGERRIVEEVLLLASISVLLSFITFLLTPR
ncbi:MAG: MraY family glycosyltransferase [Candidatus Methanodesulfokora sp.]|jgi:UDP-N-acetylglucosamine--dolichyl-phosphate N-acetylglucosaminephosphotransferase